MRYNLRCQDSQKTSFDEIYDDSEIPLLRRKNLSAENEKDTGTSSVLIIIHQIRIPDNPAVLNDYVLIRHFVKTYSQFFKIYLNLSGYRPLLWANRDLSPYSVYGR